ncbi:24638_t:CDS:2, partial [Racocetra persica]
MSIIIGPAIAVIASFLALTVVLLSFIGLEKFELPIAENSTLTGYPTWHPTIPDLDANRLNTILLFTNLICFFASIFGFYWAFYPPQDKQLISNFYENNTVVTSTPYMILDIGKLWVPIGLLCNVAEISLLACIHYGGKITAIKYWAWILRYLVIIIIGCVWLDFPYDAFWYQIQDTIPNEPDSEYPLPLSFLPQPKQLMALVFASGVHLLGDSIYVIFLNHPNAYLLGALSYAVSYGVFAYYIWLDTHCYRILPKKRIYVPET